MPLADIQVCSASSVLALSAAVLVVPILELDLELGLELRQARSDWFAFQEFCLGNSQSLALDRDRLFDLPLRPQIGVPLLR